MLDLWWSADDLEHLYEAYRRCEKYRKSWRGDPFNLLSFHAPTTLQSIMDEEGGGASTIVWIRSGSHHSWWCCGVEELWHMALQLTSPTLLGTAVDWWHRGSPSIYGWNLLPNTYYQLSITRTGHESHDQTVHHTDQRRTSRGGLHHL